MYKAERETFLGKKIKIIWNDDKGEHFFNQFTKFCKEKKFIKQTTTIYILEQNGIVKHKKKPLVENVRSMTNFVKLPNSFWVKVVSTTNYIQNKVPILVLVGIITLKEKWMDREKTLLASFKNLWMCCICAHTQREKP
jgi:hypothetical protein